MKDVCSLSVLFLTLSLFLAASFTRACQVWDPTQRIALSVSFNVTPVGVVLVACFFFLVPNFYLIQC